MQPIPKGYYRHYKGGIAKVIDQAKNSETLEEYIAYYHQESETGQVTLWVRPKKMFQEKVTINGQKIPRFEYIGTQIEAIEMKEKNSKLQKN